MLRVDIETSFNNGDLDEEYAEFIMNRSDCDRIICNGDTLTVAMEDGYLADEFINFMVNKDEH